MVRSWTQRNGNSIQIDRGLTSEGERRIILAEQTQFNRLGCETGKPDGVIVPNSRAAFKKNAEATGIDFKAVNFRSLLFLRKTGSQIGRMCR
jgi:hypothetical protein